MEAEHQQAIFEAMARPDFYPVPVRSVEVRETHISKVFLTDTLVYKIKKAVDLGFLDFSTLDRRRHFCAEEVRLNRRLSANVYLYVDFIHFDGKRYSLGGAGPVVEAAVCMRRLPDDRSMLNLLHGGSMDSGRIGRLSRVLANFYGSSAETLDGSCGQWKQIQRLTAENFECVSALNPDFIRSDWLAITRAAAEAFLNRHGAIFENRRAGGRIRDGHGDLRCGHIYFDQGIQIIDCVEFDPLYRCGDIASEIAFLAMDLDFEGYEPAGRTVAETVARLTEDPQLLALIDFYKCYRAMVRVKVNCLRLSGGSPPIGETGILRRQSVRFMELAYFYALVFSRPTLWVICGLPASGKSSLAARLSEVLGVEVLSSDVIRKGIYDLPADQNVDVAFESGIYSQAATARTYGGLLLNAQESLAGGRSVILDATFSSHKNRRKAWVLAHDEGANIVFVECVAPQSELQLRLAARSGQDIVTDARLHHWPDLKAHYESFSDIGEPWHLEVDTSRPFGPSLLLRLLAHERAMRADLAHRVFAEK